MLVNDSHGGLGLRREAAAFRNQGASVGQDACLVLVYIGLSLFRRIKEQVKVGIFILEVKAQHFLAVIHFIALGIFDSQGKIKSILRVCGEIVGFWYSSSRIA